MLEGPFGRNNNKLANLFIKVLQYRGIIKVTATNTPAHQQNCLRQHMVHAWATAQCSAYEPCVMFDTNIITCNSCRQGEEVLNALMCLPLYTWILTKWVKPLEISGFTSFFWHSWPALFSFDHVSLSLTKQPFLWTLTIRDLKCWMKSNKT